MNADHVYCGYRLLPDHELINDHLVRWWCSCGETRILISHSDWPPPDEGRADAAAKESHGEHMRQQAPSALGLLSG